MPPDVTILLGAAPNDLLDRLLSDVLGIDQAVHLKDVIGREGLGGAPTIPVNARPSRPALPCGRAPHRGWRGGDGAGADDGDRVR